MPTKMPCHITDLPEPPTRRCPDLENPSVLEIKQALHMGKHVAWRGWYNADNNFEDVVEGASSDLFVKSLRHLISGNLLLERQAAVQLKILLRESLHDIATTIHEDNADRGY